MYVPFERVYRHDHSTDKERFHLDVSIGTTIVRIKKIRIAYHADGY